MLKQNIFRYKIPSGLFKTKVPIPIRVPDTCSWMYSLHFTFPITYTDRWGTTDDYATSSLHLFPFSTSLGVGKLQPCALFDAVFLPLLLSTSSSSPLSWYLVRCFLRGQMRCGRITSVCASWPLSGLCTYMIQWLIGSCCGPLHW